MNNIYTKRVFPNFTIHVRSIQFLPNTNIFHFSYAKSRGKIVDAKPIDYTWINTKENMEFILYIGRNVFSIGLEYI